MARSYKHKKPKALKIFNILSVRHLLEELVIRFPMSLKHRHLKIFNPAIFKIVYVLMVCAPIVFCTSARDREKPTHVLEGAKFTENEREAYLKSSMKSGDIYYNYKPELHIDALYRNADYIARLADEYADNIFHTDAEKQSFLNRELTAEKKFTTLIISVHSIDGVDKVLEKTGGGWEIKLKLGEDIYLSPANITEMLPASREIAYLKKYLRVFDRFSEFYRVDFPLVQLPNENQSDANPDLVLVVNGINGSMMLKFP